MAKTPYYAHIEARSEFLKHLDKNETLGESAILWDEHTNSFRQFVRVIRKPKKDPPRTR